MNKNKILIIVSSLIVLIGIFIMIFVINSNKKNNTFYEVTFDTQGGSIIESQSIKKGETITVPENPTKEGYEFLGWYYENQNYDFNTAVNDNITLVASYEAKKENVETYVIKFDTDCGSVILDQIVEKNANVKKPEEPVRDGYMFIGWYLDDEEYNFDMPVIKDLTIKARWEKGKISNNKTNNGSNSNSNNNSNSNSNNLKLRVPTLTVVGQGGDPDSWGKSYKITDVEFAEGIELYKSTTGSNYTLEKSFTISQLSQNNMKINITAYIGEHNYYKVRAYKNVNGKKVYSDYTDAIEVSY